MTSSHSWRFIVGYTATNWKHFLGRLCVETAPADHLKEVFRTEVISVYGRDDLSCVLLRSITRKLAHKTYLLMVILYCPLRSGYIFFCGQVPKAGEVAVGNSACVHENCQESTQAVKHVKVEV